MLEPDWIAPLPGHAALLNAKLEDGVVKLEVEGAASKHARAAVARRFATLGDVEVVARRLEPRRCVGHMEREKRRLQLRYDIVGDEHLSTIFVAEDEARVIVFGMMCVSDAGALDDRVVECPYHVYLDAPLGGRPVIDGFSGEVVEYKNVYLELQRRLGQGDTDEYAHTG